MSKRFAFLLAGAAMAAAAPALAQKAPEDIAARIQAERAMAQQREADQQRQIQELQNRLDVQEQQRASEQVLQNMQDQIRRSTTYPEPPQIVYIPGAGGSAGKTPNGTPADIAASNARLRQIGQELKTVQTR